MCIRRNVPKDICYSALRSGLGRELYWFLVLHLTHLVAITTHTHKQFGPRFTQPDFLFKQKVDFHIWDSGNCCKLVQFILHTSKVIGKTRNSLWFCNSIFPVWLLLKTNFKKKEPTAQIFFLKKYYREYYITAKVAR